MYKHNYSKSSEYEEPLKYSSVLCIIDKTITTDSFDHPPCGCAHLSWHIGVTSC